jgi:hypothetical protein
VLLRINGIGIQRSDSLALFCGRKKIRIFKARIRIFVARAQIWVTFGTIFFLQFLVLLFCSFIRLASILTTVTDLFCGIWGFGSERSGSDSNPFFRIGLKIRKSRSLKSGIRNNTHSPSVCGSKPFSNSCSRLNSLSVNRQTPEMANFWVPREREGSDSLTTRHTTVHAHRKSFGDS